MKLKIKLVLLAISISLSTFGQSVFTPYTKIFLNNIGTKAQKSYQLKSPEKRNAQAKKFIQNIRSKEYIPVFIELKEASAVDDITRLGGLVGTQVGTLLTASVPLTSLTELATLESVKLVDLAKIIKKNNDTSRPMTGMTDVQSGTGLTQPYTGKGVIYGTVDTGIDFNHVAFKNADGSSRILYAYLPDETGGPTATGYVYDYTGRITPNGTFPGSIYGNGEISSLTTDNETASHGSHTIGIGAGYNSSNKYYGMATEADIIACGTSLLYDVTLLNAMSLSFGKGDELGKPVVFNMSLGSNIGPHDGTTITNRLMDQMTNEGKIIVLSAGNEGDYDLYVHKHLDTSSDSLLTFFTNSDGSYEDLSGGNYFDFWSKTRTNYDLKIVVYDKETHQRVYESAKFTTHAINSELSLSSDFDPAFAAFGTGTISAYTMFYHDNNKYEIMGDIDVTLNSSKYMLGLLIKSDEGAEVEGWTDANTIYTNGDMAEATKGSPDRSFNELGYGDNIISVGLYTSKDKFTNVNGNTYTFPAYPMNDISPFSSYDTEGDIYSRPNIVAPGTFIVSAVNSYDLSYKNGGYNSSCTIADNEIDGKHYLWGAMSGTSMAAPCVSGIIATWLQADPTLTPARIKNIFSRTAIRDSYVANGNQAKWGYGKIDAYNGLIDVLNTTSIDNIAADNRPMMVYPNPSNGVFTLVVPSAKGRLDLDVYDVNGRLVATQQCMADGCEINVDLSNKLASGFYYLKVRNKSFHGTQKLIIVK